MMDAQTKKQVEQRLAEIEDEGRLTPDAVVEDARSESSPLHGLFEWDDAKAAHKQRIERARTIIRSVVVQRKVDKKTVSSVCYVRDPSAGREQGYASVAKIRTDAEQAQQVMYAELDRIESCLRRAREVASVLGLDQEMEVLIGRVLSIRDDVGKAA